MIVEKISTGELIEMDRATYEKLINRGTRYKIISEDDELTQAAKEFKGSIPAPIEDKIKQVRKQTTKKTTNGTRSKKTTDKSI